MLLFTFQLRFVHDEVRPDLADLLSLDERQVSAQVLQVEGVGGAAVVLAALVLHHGAVEAGAPGVGLADEVNQGGGVGNQGLHERTF